MLMTLAAMFSTGVPRLFSLTNANQIHLSTIPDVAVAIHQMTGVTSGSATKGFMQKDGYDDGDAISWNTGNQWATPASGWGTVYVRLTAITNTMDASSHTIDGSTWHTFTEDVTNIWFRDEHDGLPAESATVQVEIATDSGGTNIVATGEFSTTVSAEA